MNAVLERCIGGPLKRQVPFSAVRSDRQGTKTTAWREQGIVWNGPRCDCQPVSTKKGLRIVCSYRARFQMGARGHRLNGKCWSRTRFRTTDSSKQTSVDMRSASLTFSTLFSNSCSRLCISGYVFSTENCITCKNRGRFHKQVNITRFYKLPIK